MASSVADFKLASTAAGFTLGFGLLTVWKAIKQTKNIRAPLRSVYIYMVWGEIVANTVIGILAWLLLDGTLSPTVPVLFSLLFLWVFEIQLLMQIIINRISVVVDDYRLIRKIKWGTALIITLINIAVFIIWIPAHIYPPPIPVMVEINKYWDRTSKVLILVVDAALNYYFLRVVQKRLVKYHGLTKYAPLVGFNAKLMVISVGMDLMLILLMSLNNPLVYVQFHPVVYTVKLNIEMSMASLITKLAKASVADRVTAVSTSTHQNGMTMYSRNHADFEEPHRNARKGVLTTVSSMQNPAVDGSDGIRTTKEVHVQVNHARNGSTGADGSGARPGVKHGHQSDDELPLAPGTEHRDFEAQAWSA